MVILRELLTTVGLDFDDDAVGDAADSFIVLKNTIAAVRVAFENTVGKISDVINEMVDAGDQAAKTGKQIGLTAEEVQELTFAVERSGGSFEQLRTGILKLQQRASEATSGNKEYAETFREIGIGNAQLARGLQDPIALLLETASGLNAVETQGDRARIAMKLFEEGGAALLPFLAEGADGINALRNRARALGFVIDNETAEAAERMADNFLDLQLVTTGLSRRFAARLLPTIERITTAIIDWTIENRALIDSGIRLVADAVEGLIDGLSFVTRVIRDNITFITILAGVFGALFLPNILAATSALTIFAAKAVLSAAIAAAPFVVLIGILAFIALVIEDVFVLVSGGDSLIGELFTRFGTAEGDPNAHWMVRTLGFIINRIVAAIRTVEEFFRGFFAEAERLGGVGAAVRSALVEPFVFAEKQVKRFFRFLRDEIESIPGIGDIIAGRSSVLGTLAAGFARDFAPTGPVGAAGAAAAAAVGGAGGGSTVVGGSNIAVTVTPPVGATVDETAGAVGQAVERVTAEERRRTAEDLQAGRRRR